MKEALEELSNKISVVEHIIIVLKSNQDSLHNELADINTRKKTIDRLLENAENDINDMHSLLNRIENYD